MTKSTWTAGILLFGLVACNDNSTLTEKKETEISVLTQKSKELKKLSGTKITQDGTNVDEDYYVIKYVAIDEPTAVVVAEEEFTKHPPKATFTKNKAVTEPAEIEDIDSKVNNQTSRALPPINIRYRTFGSDANRDRPPVFSQACLSAASISECTEQAIHEYIEANLAYPETALEEGHDGYEKVTFVIDKNGKVKSTIKVASKDKPCEGCAKASVQVIANMPNWLPALENGEPVSTEVTLPIRFDYRGEK